MSSTVSGVEGAMENLNKRIISIYFTQLSKAT